MKQILTILLLLGVGAGFYLLGPLVQPGPLGELASYFAEHGVEDNHAANLVTAVVVNYRGFDTLGEVVVLFASVAGAGFVLRRRDGLRRLMPVPASELVDTGAKALVPGIMVFGAYIFVHGHLTPGGGFQGGAVIASAVLLLLLADRERHLPHALMSWAESLSGFGIVAIGLVGLALTGSFLANKGVVSLGEWNRLLSGGLIPLIYILVGFKVGTELAALLDSMVRSGEAEEVA